MFRVKDKRRNESRRINFTFSLAPFDSTLTSVSVINLFRPDNYRIFFQKEGEPFSPVEKKERLERKVTGTHRSNVVRNASRVHGQISNIVLHRERVGNEGLTASPKKNSWKEDNTKYNTHFQNAS